MVIHESIIYILLPLALALSYFSIGMSNSQAGPKLQTGTSLKAALIFGIIALMWAVTGFMAGRMVKNYIIGNPVWVASAILFFTGFRLVIHGWKRKALIKIFDVNLTTVILALAVALGINMFFTGVALSLFENIHMMKFSITAALTIAVLTFSGMLYGQYFNIHLGWRSEIAGGLIIWLSSIWIMSV
jgi:putative Mn2+ efflux pump MntP